MYNIEDYIKIYVQFKEYNLKKKKKTNTQAKNQTFASSLEITGCSHPDFCDVHPLAFLVLSSICLFRDSNFCSRAWHIVCELHRNEAFALILPGLATLLSMGRFIHIDTCACGSSIFIAVFHHTNTVN